MYHDARRVGSYLAQFDPSGHLQGIKESDAVSASRKPEVAIKAGISIPGLPSVTGEGPEASIGFTRGASEAGHQGSERAYDPYWANARTFLDFLEERGLLNREVSTAALGEIVMVRGALSVLDLRVLKAAWESPLVQSLAGQPGENNANPMANLIGLEALRIMPHSVQATMRTPEQETAWMMLDETSLVGNASDFMLKHGVQIGGAWRIVGVLDAHPDHEVLQEMPQPRFAQDNLFLAAMQQNNNIIGTLAAALAPMARFVMGRPGSAYGLTPLLIFREVAQR
jgi:hypothetical protein